MLMHISNYSGGLSASDTREYFDIASYRNVLTTLNTLDKLRVRYESNLSAQMPNVERALKASFGWGWRPVLPPAATGYVIQKTGSASVTEPLLYPQRLVRNLAPPGGGYFNKGDLLSVARALQSEMNRLRLPLPSNYIQLLDKIQNLNFVIPQPQRYECGSDVTEYCWRNLDMANYVAWLKAMENIPQLRAATIVIRNAIRKEIDAANLAAKVNEETLRREASELISRQAAAAEAEKRKLIILEEKKAAIQKEFEEAEKLKSTMAAEKEKLLKEKIRLNAEKENAASQSEAENIKQRQLLVDNNINRVDAIVSDKVKSLNTARQAAGNINAEIIDIAKQNKTLNTNTEKPVNIKTILLTVAAGAFLL